MSVLFLTTVKEKYVRIYEKFISELKSYSKAIRILSKGYLPITLIMSIQTRSNITTSATSHYQNKSRL